ncbi:MAG: YHS domain-containing (seleno)protein [Pseudomonadota bacterium]
MVFHQVLPQAFSRFLSVFLLVFLGFSGTALAEKPEIYLSSGGVFSSGWEFALDGYDTVAYFTEGKPVKGDPAYKTVFKGVTWIFANQKNLDSFLDDPDRYRPQYGGYCAYAVAQGTTAKGDPEQWYIEDGKLYLNLNPKILKRWVGQKAEYIEAADNNWPKVIND